MSQKTINAYLDNFSIFYTYSSWVNLTISFYFKFICFWPKNGNLPSKHNVIYAIVKSNEKKPDYSLYRITFKLIMVKLLVYEELSYRFCSFQFHEIKIHEYECKNGYTIFFEISIIVVM